MVAQMSKFTERLLKNYELIKWPVKLSLLKQNQVSIRTPPRTARISGLKS